ncbi:MAG: aminotransferase class I/II-fold pyridoxal phosphate-dependent enzyme [Bacteroidetes bacterium]|nr:aminotransferase class I/II-fold pyridoxal phosphate-dependent enzyme [Bacteroidota bacterium]
MINLLSDTVTKPTPGMLQAMMQAEVGDDVFKEDPTVRALEERSAALFAQEAGLFCPSGTMANQIALKVHTRPLEEVLCDETSHIYQYEVAGYAFHSGIGLQLLSGKNGIIQAGQIEAAIRPQQDWLPKSTLVVLENTANKGGGTVYPLNEIEAIRAMCLRRKLALHMDGARIFNACLYAGYSPEHIGRQLDSISVCFSKGLGAPVGSVLLGSRDFIAEARRVRKVMGGGMRQAGYLAAAGLYALDHQVERLAEDHVHARMLAEALAQLDYVAAIRPVQTNIVIFDLIEGVSTAQLLAFLEKNSVKASAFGPQTIRFVTHLDVDRVMIETAMQVLGRFRP